MKMYQYNIASDLPALLRQMRPEMQQLWDKLTQPSFTAPAILDIWYQSARVHILKDYNLQIICNITPRYYISSNYDNDNKNIFHIWTQNPVDDTPVTAEECQAIYCMPTKYNPWNEVYFNFKYV